MKKLRFIVMHCGYVENSTTSALIYQCQFFGNPGYSSYKQAITDLALDLYAKYYTDELSIYERRYSKYFDRCCRETLTKDRVVRICAKCLKPIFDQEFDAEGFMYYISELHRSTCDSYGEAESTYERHFTWWPYWTEEFIGAPKDEVIFMGENAEVTLLAALLEAKPELNNSSCEDHDFSMCDWESFKNETQPEFR